MNAYSLDLRLKVLDAIDRGIPRREVVRTFSVSMPTMERLPQTQEANWRDLAPEALPRTNAFYLRYLRESADPMEAARRERRSDA